MELRYANSDDVLSELVVDDEDVLDAHVVSQVERMEAALASAFDHKVGRSFGVAAVPSTRSIHAGNRADALVLSRPARSIESVHIGGAWDGTSWVGEEEVTNWRPRYDRDGFIYGVEGGRGSWPASVRVTAVWASDSEEAVPDDVSHALTWLTIRQYRRMTASPNELVGPEGFTVPTPHAWDDPMVKDIIAKYRVVEVVV